MVVWIETRIPETFFLAFLSTHTKWMYKKIIANEKECYDVVYVLPSGMS